MWVGVEFYTILMKWCKNWCGLEMLLRAFLSESRSFGTYFLILMKNISFIIFVGISPF